MIMKGVGGKKGVVQNMDGIAVKDEVESTNETTRFNGLRMDVMIRSLNS
jgi:hypothetical protein